MRKRTLLIAVKPPSLLRLIEHLFDDQPEFRIVARTEQTSSLVRRSSSLAPDLIVISFRLLGKECRPTLASIKSSSPDSKLILLHPGGPRPRGGDADADLQEEDIVRRLLPTAHRLAGGLAPPGPRPRRRRAASFRSV